MRDVGGNLTKLSLLRRVIETGSKLGPRMFMAGPILDGIPPLWPSTSFLVDTPERAMSAVRFLVAEGIDLVKVCNSVSETSHDTVIRTAHDEGVPVTGHVPRAITTTRAIELGMDCLEHIRITGRELLLPEEAADIDFLPLTRREALLWERFDLDAPRVKIGLEMDVARFW